MNVIKSLRNYVWRLVMFLFEFLIWTVALIKGEAELAEVFTIVLFATFSFSVTMLLVQQVIGFREDLEASQSRSILALNIILLLSVSLLIKSAQLRLIFGM